MRRLLALAALSIATLVLGLRVREINKPAPPVALAPRTVHLLYLDSLRRELVTFAEQYGRPVFKYDTIAPVNGYGRIQFARLRQALFDPHIEYGYTDKGFAMDWRSDPKPKMPRPDGALSFAEFSNLMRVTHHRPISDPWPMSAADYARLRRLWITPQWPDAPVRRANRRPASGVPPHADAYSIAALSPTP